jgi:hypothetical protein
LETCPSSSLQLGAIDLHAEAGGLGDGEHSVDTFLAVLPLALGMTRRRAMLSCFAQPLAKSPIRCWNRDA